jgi:hypothetical protein
VSATVVSIALLVSFTSWVILHAALAYGLIRRRRRRWALLWLVVPPLVWLAPYWGFKHRLLGLSVSWIVCAAAYLALLFVGARWPTG